MTVTIRSAASFASRARARISERSWPIALTAVSLATGMAYSFWWPHILHRRNYWMAPGDLWSTFGLARQLAFGVTRLVPGSLRNLEATHNAYLGFPVIIVALAPVALLAHSLSLRTPPPFDISAVRDLVARPPAWLVLGPAEIIMASAALFALDALASQLGITKGRRSVLCVVEAAALWQVDVVWGHPEDALAVAFLIYGFIALLQDRPVKAGWLFGVALVTQPLVLLALPVCIAAAPRGQRMPLLARSAILPVLVRVPSIALYPGSALHWLASQPNYPLADHVTPWVYVAPGLPGGAVAAGPGRALAIVVACGVGVLALRHRRDAPTLVWLLGVALALRCFFEAVIDPFYVWPLIAVSLVALAATHRRWRLAVLTVVSGFLTVFSYWRLGAWTWWGTLSVLIVVVLALSRPRATRQQCTGESRAEVKPSLDL